MTARLAVDIGGTFTDVVLELSGGRVTTKTPTTPLSPADGVLRGIDRVLAEAGLQPQDVGLVLHGTTLATNAILERKGAVTALVTTAGFRDVLEIGYETRFDQYDLQIEKPQPLVPRARRFTVPERIDVEGRVRLPLDEAAVMALLPALDAAGVESVAIGFLHAYANPVHERRVANLLAAARPQLTLTLSSDVCPEIREYERFTTATANAYVKPLMSRYLADLEARLVAAGLACPVLMMTSGGGLCTLATARALPIRLVESGPAGGAILAGAIAEELDERRVLAFDMGGTTAKICLLHDFRPQAARELEVDRSARHQKGSGLPLRIPVIEMVEIGAGGGSIARIDGMGRIAVGPTSAGAVPGPAAYDQGGAAPTVTDADLLLGRISPARFAGGTVRLSTERARQALATLASGLGGDAVLAAVGVSEVVDEAMANAARRHAVERGRTVADHSLVAFGGAAPLHACRVARKLGIRRIVVPADAGVGSAIGFLRAPIAFEQVRSLRMRLAAFDLAAVAAVFDALRLEAEAVVRAGAPEAAVHERRTAYARYVGQGHEVVVPLPDGPLDAQAPARLQAAFETVYRRHFRRIIPHAEIEVLSWGLAVEAARPPLARPPAVTATAAPTAAETAAVVDPTTGGRTAVPVVERARLAAGATLAGPVLVVEPQTTTNVAAGFVLTVAGNGALILEDRT